MTTTPPSPPPRDDGPLFRPEALAARVGTLTGPALSIGPVGARVWTALVVALALAVLGVLIWGQHTRKERVTGVLQARSGVSTLVAPGTGVLMRLPVKEGQTVRAGDVLAEIHQTQHSDLGDALSQVEVSLRERQQALRTEAARRHDSLQARLSGLDERTSHLRQSARSLQTELQLQAQQQAVAERLLEQMRPLRDDRIVSELQFAQQLQLVTQHASRQQELRRQSTQMQAELAQVQTDRQRLLADEAAQSALRQRDALTLHAEQAQRRREQVMLLRAPVNGTVTNLRLAEGQTVAGGATVLSVVPAASPLEAVLRVPSTAMGFLRPGQTVRLAYDAFPYQRFGQHRGQITAIPLADVPASELGGNRQDTRAVFLVHVALERDTVVAYGQALPLRSGHTLVADIEIESRALWRWLFDPLFAFTGRL